MASPSAVIRPPRRRSQMRSRCRADSFAPPVSGYERPRRVDGAADLLVPRWSPVATDAPEDRRSSAVRRSAAATRTPARHPHPRLSDDGPRGRLVRLARAAAQGLPQLDRRQRPCRARERLGRCAAGSASGSPGGHRPDARRRVRRRRGARVRPLHAVGLVVLGGHRAHRGARRDGRHRPSVRRPGQRRLPHTDGSAALHACSRSRSTSARTLATSGRPRAHGNAECGSLGRRSATSS